MLNKAHLYSRKWNFQFDADKTGVLVYTTNRKRSKVKSVLNDHIKTETDCHTHLGILQDTRITSVARTTSTCNRGRNVSMHTNEMKPLGINSLTSTSLYKKVIILTTCILYGCGLWGQIDNVNNVTNYSILS